MANTVGDLATVINKEYVGVLLPIIVYMCTLAVVGTIANTVTILVSCCKRKQIGGLIPVFVIRCFGIMDVVVCALAIPLQVSFLFHYFIWNEPKASIFDARRLLCKGVARIVCWEIVATSLILIVTALDRYNIVCKKFRYTLTPAGTRCMIWFSLILAFLLDIPHVILGDDVTIVTARDIFLSKPYLIYDGINSSFVAQDVNDTFWVCEHVPLHSHLEDVSFMFFAILAIFFFICLLVTSVFYGLLCRYFMVQDPMKMLTDEVIRVVITQNETITPGVAGKPGIKKSTEARICDAISRQGGSADLEQLSVQFKEELEGGPEIEELDEKDQGGEANTSGCNKETEKLHPPEQQEGMQFGKCPRTTTKIMFAITILYVITLAPFIGLRLYGKLMTDAMDQHKDRIAMYNTALLFLNYLFFLSNTIKPFLYFLIDSSFRQDCYDLFSCTCIRG
ncbi:uncharacterized protein LOC135488228 [Lineus longissimus]|uniref:uncharacterized protein LOC135488228 n=1 Tax=Lineus longissimus TaxID=88925 RepID=UPI00315DCB83